MFAISEHRCMRLILEKAARKGLDRMSSKAAAALLRRLEAIASAPDGKHANVKPLAGAANAFRLRQGAWRAVYVLDRKLDEMRVVLVDVRGSVYR
jgi:mRNA-degrading endonuclease RelE of RelBE toxin-antitoxin system